MASAVCMALNFTASAERKENGDFKRIRVPENVGKSRILIVGGSGAVGRNTAAALSKLCPNLHIIIGGRNRDKGARVVETLGYNSEFAYVDIEDVNSINAAMTDVDLVVHAAGPFEYADCNVLEAAIRSKTAYIDVSDSERYARQAKSYKSKAMAAGVPAITNCGVGPGDSENINYVELAKMLFLDLQFTLCIFLVTVMAAMLVHTAESESRGQPERLRFHYFTAGSGGTGPAVLATSIFLFGDEAVTYHKGTKMKSSPYSNMLSIDFGEGIGKKEVFLLNLAEVESTHEVLGVPTVSARFGTAPFFWNWAISALIKQFPAEYLRDKNIVQRLVPVAYPIIRAMDAISGETFSIKVDLQCSDGCNTAAVFSHKRLSEAAGTATAAFVIAVLEGSTKPGVWFPEEPEGIAIEARETLLRRAAKGATESFCRREQTEEMDPLEKSNWIVQ
ncbi:hypothetical protein DH2020_000959 [Rehmannia glutinosa]|uniref:Saccharopine dehydrogenase NADP binding domain-containing protein n=1 Tax=Rehmannia glutinosa TaxID=99300 RepID=A0ABR0XY04_REHGL